MKKYKHELIGEEVIIASSKNESLKGLKGVVRDETRNTLLLETSKGFKRVLKNSADFKVKERLVKGEELLARPEERVKSR